MQSKRATSRSLFPRFRAVVLWLLIGINAVAALIGWQQGRAITGSQSTLKRSAPPLAASNWAWPVLGGCNVALLLAAVGLGRRVAESDAEDAEFLERDAWPIALARLDERGRITDSNVSFGQLLGASTGAEITLASFSHPDDSALNDALLGKLRYGTLKPRDEERRFFRADGTPFCARWQVRPHHDTAFKTAEISIQDISHQRALETELGRARSAIHELYQIVAGEGDLSAKMQSLVALGCNRFATETGFIGQVNEARLKVLCVHSADERIRRGQLYDLGEARRDGALARPKGPRGLLHAAPDDWREQPVFSVTEGESYLGAPIMVEGKIWGTLNFSDPDGRDTFAIDDTEFLQLMAQWLGSEIERHAARAALEEQRGQLLKANLALETLAVQDGLTGLKNRRAFDEQLKLEWQRARRYKTPLSLLLLDVDKFKHYNDNFGHPEGDEVLRRVARVLAAGVRNIDFVARYGGEEFVLLLPNTDRDGAKILADRLRANIEAAQWPLRAVTASFGAATIAPTMNEATDLTKFADLSLYQSKENGRNRVTHSDNLPTAPAE